MNFSSWLKKLRESAGLSQTELAKEIGISRGSISFYENGERVPDIEILRKLCDFFRISADLLIGRTQEAFDEMMVTVCGLSRDSIEQIQRASVKKVNALNRILKRPEFWELLDMEDNA